MSGKDALIHVDSHSVGVYPAELAISQRDFASDFGDGDHFRGTVDEPDLAIHEQMHPPPRLAYSPASGERGVHTYIVFSTQVAWNVALCSLPGFWAYRFPRSGPLRNLEPGAKIPFAAIAQRRATNRLKLLGTADSMLQKTWAISYHRKRFARAIEQVRLNPTAPSLVKLTAEFAAHDNAIYGLLDEIAALCNTVAQIIGKNPCPSSFHSLTQRTGSLPPELVLCFSSLHWYETFHQRRSCATHAFSAHVAAQPEGDLAVFQIPVLRSSSPPTLEVLGNAQSIMDEMSNGLNSFLLTFAQQLLTMFHPFDVARLTTAEAIGEPTETFLVWTRRIAFRDGLCPSARPAFVDAGTMLQDEELA